MLNRPLLSICLVVSCYILSGCTFISSSDDFSMSSDRRKTDVVLMDHSLELRAQKIISSIPELSSSRIRVHSFNGHILLLGQTDSEDNLHLLTQRVSELPGARKIFNQVTLEPTLGPIEWFKDRLIYSKIKTSMIGSQGINPLRIQVFTEKKVVYLVGIVYDQEEKTAGTIAENIRGVDKVVKVFERI